MIREHHDAKYRVGDLLMLCLAAKEAGFPAEQRANLARQLRCAIATARSIADQRSAGLRDEGREKE